MNIPNLLTILRILLVPVVVWAISQGQMSLALAGFVIAGVTDGIDGYIAKRFDQRTELGAYLDPLADKTLIVSIYVSLAIFGFIPPWVAILVVSRDFMIVGAVLLSTLMGNPLVIQPLYISKANTAAQILFATLVLASLGLKLDLAWPITVVMWSVAALTLSSAAAYLVAWTRHMSAPGGGS
ncbi:CDP-alcohol phosphatidyltransferase family protein [Phreatobacter aquaticus]|uniref:CDP-diacylglycerol--glycerol-3-phosphate 3-phosphatidyltransferase n=1 Tax=Phreatobacter aquaticus TaxID=2570229 RepID=A0A4D7QQF9_9HYPH|nr:CDP-alcohol phosphatidyltransferase family protein [Phreatobacter aquaticus]QCK87749.1 CDP-alcohol phosphatidyltransferase family protein [Phreatobacter aquaticus]